MFCVQADVTSKRGILKRRADKRKTIFVDADKRKTILIDVVTPASYLTSGLTASNMTSSLDSDGEDLEALVQEKMKTNLKRRATQIPATIPDIEFTESSIEIR